MRHSVISHDFGFEVNIWMHNLIVGEIRWIYGSYALFHFVRRIFNCETFILTTFEIFGLNIKHHLLWWLTAIHKSFHIHLAHNSFWWFFSSLHIRPNGNYIDSFSFELFSFSLALSCEFPSKLIRIQVMCVSLVVLF